MLFKPAFIATTTLATLAAATPLHGRTEPTCSSTEVKCCDHVGTVTNVSSFLGGVLGLPYSLLPLATLIGVVEAVVGPVIVGLTCSPLVDLGGCNAQTVCCENVAFSGLINVGCVAVGI